MPWGWLLAILMLCTLQGWLLAIASGYAFFVFLFCSLFVVRTIAFSAHPKHISRWIWMAWSAAIAWTVAGSVFDAWHGEILWATAIAVMMAMFLAVVLSWAWMLTISMASKELLKGSGAIEAFIILMLNSWLGIGIGLLSAALSSRTYLR